MTDQSMANDLTQIPPLGTGELQVTTTSTAVMQEIQGVIMLAKHFPRDYQSCWQKLMDACKRKTLAISAGYSFPRGGKQIEGPSVNLARVASQCYGNFRVGLDILRCDDDLIHIRAWAWDVENNTKSSLDDVFKNLIYRKTGGWIKPDERDLRELIFRRGAILKRNCIFECIPRDMIEDAMGVCKTTIKKGIKDPKSEAKKLILELGDFNITVEQIRAYVGHDDDWTKDDIVLLQGVVASIRDGNSKPSEYFGRKKEQVKPTGSMSTDQMKPGDASTHKGYDEPADNDDKTVPADTEAGPDANAGDLADEIQEACLDLEKKKDLGGSGLLDYRTDVLGYADFGKASFDQLQAYHDILVSLPNKGGDF